MSQYKNRRESKMTLQEFKLQEARNLLERADWNGAPTMRLANYLNTGNGISDVILGDSSCYVLPKDKESAEKLWKFATPKPGTEDFGIADEVNWLKIEDRWWLSLWWD